MSRFVPLLGCALLAVACLSAPASAQQPDLKLMVPAAPGGGWDQTARTMQQALTASGLTRSVQVQNVAGAGGSIGFAQFVNGAKGDGNQMMVSGFAMVSALTINKSPVTLAQVTPIARLTDEAQVIVVPAGSPIKDARDLAAALKADIGSVSFAGASVASIDHITAALFAKAAGADPAKLNYMPFSGGRESLAAVLSAKVTAGISGIGEYEGEIKSGKLRAIGISSAQRIAGVDIPTFKEQGIDLELSNWRSVVAPPGINESQRKALIGLVETMAKSQPWQQSLKQKGWDDALMTGDAFAGFLKTENERVAGVLQSLGFVAGTPPSSAVSQRPSTPAVQPSQPARPVQQAQPAPPPAALQPPSSAAQIIAAAPSAPAPALQDRRVALVIGNSAYTGVPALPNPKRDAQSIGEALRSIGFQTVTIQNDLNKDKLTNALRVFAREAERADWAIIYYAGHGIEVGGINYLIPIDARLGSDRDVSFEGVPLDQVLNAVERAGKLKLIILDACRDNPFASQMKRTMTAATRSVSRGLTQVEPEAGTMVVYSAKHGETALDGDTSNSPFASALLKNLRTPGLEVRRLFDYVRDDVMELTKRRQQPFSYGSISGRQDFFFVAAK